MTQPLGGEQLNRLWQTIRTEIAKLMRWYNDEDDQERGEVEEEHGSPSTGAKAQKCSWTKGGKSKRKGQWLMEHNPWDAMEEEEGNKGPLDEGPSRDVLDAAVRHIMHKRFGHQSWALHTFAVSMAGSWQVRKQLAMK